MAGTILQLKKGFVNDEADDDKMMTEKEYNVLKYWKS